MVLYFWPQRTILNVYRKRRLTAALQDIPLVTVVYFFNYMGLYNLNGVIKLPNWTSKMTAAKPKQLKICIKNTKRTWSLCDKKIIKFGGWRGAAWSSGQHRRLSLQGSRLRIPLPTFSFERRMYRIEETKNVSERRACKTRRSGDGGRQWNLNREWIWERLSVRK